MRRSIALVFAAALALAACSSAAGSTTNGGTTSATATTAGRPSGATGTSASTGPTGATGSTDEPAGRSRFAGRVSPLPPAMASEMSGTTWHPGCPVPLADLALLRFNYLNLDGEVQRGPLVVNAAAATDVLWVFKQLFEARFPIKRVGLAREFSEKRLENAPDTRRSVTASFNCRPVVTPDGAQSTFSQHSYGLAVDVNPLQNPFVRSDGWVRNRFAKPYVDRSADLPGMIHPDDVVVRSFAAIGWSWGGTWSGDKDYMHFSQSGT
jgi:D-alanyl-D-alanine carboxypeptidase